MPDCQRAPGRVGECAQHFRDAAELLMRLAGESAGERAAAYADQARAILALASELEADEAHTESGRRA